MKKIFLMIAAIFFAGTMSFAQEDEGGGSGGDFGLMAGYTVNTSSIFGLQGAWLSTGDGIFSDGFGASWGAMLTVRYNSADMLTNDRLGVQASFVPNVFKGIYLIAGAGYGKYVYPYENPFEEDLEIAGLEWNAGVMVRLFKKVTLSAGMSTLNNERNDYYAGIGYIF